MGTPSHPLAEVFGFPTDNNSTQAARCRKYRLCPFGNRVPNCTKDKASNPLGVCSIYDDSDVVVVCPVRFRENWLIAEDAADFFFPRGATWTTFSEVRLNDRQGKSAGNVDVVLVSYDENGKVTDFGALEIQAVYISGNIRTPFEYFMQSPSRRKTFSWAGHANYPKPDYLSSSRKRLAPQLIFKGGIFRTWQKKVAVALSRPFFQTLPSLDQVSKDNADVAWLVYDLVIDSSQNRFRLERHVSLFTKFDETMEKITRSEAGDVQAFVQRLQEKVDEKLEPHGPLQEDAEDDIEVPF